MTRVRDTFEPDQQTHRFYDDLYRNVYRRMYQQLKPLYEELYHLFPGKV